MNGRKDDAGRQSLVSIVMFDRRQNNHRNHCDWYSTSIVPRERVVIDYGESFEIVSVFGSVDMDHLWWITIGWLNYRVGGA